VPGFLKNLPLILSIMELDINFSDGKDSCVMLHLLYKRCPAIPKGVAFADTGWEHTNGVEWAASIVSRYGLPLHVVGNPNKDFFGMVRHRKKFPSAGKKQCTSDLKRGPIETWIRRNCKDKVIINCMGLHAEESRDRRNRLWLKRNRKMTNGKRTVWDWLPIKDWKESEVLEYLSLNDIPLHPAYKYLKRFSCRICIFMSLDDLRQVKIHDPNAFQQVASLDREIGFSMRADTYLDEIQ
jgi:DNA sulfur modification protein DndC